MYNATLILGLLLILALLGVIARRLPIPLPILWVIGGIFISFVPDASRFQLDPEFFFLFFFPPLLYSDAWIIPKREFKDYLQPILFLSLGLVLTTTLIVGYFAEWLIPELSLPLAFALGAVISPTDAVAVSSILKRLKIPQRVSIILKGESLINDASALVSFRFALLGVTLVSFSFIDASLKFLTLSLGGVCFGLLIAWALRHLSFFLIKNKLSDPTIELTISLLVPFAAYISAEYFHASGILAIVASGFYFARGNSKVPPEVRLQSKAVWSMILFVLNGIVFMQLGLYLPNLFNVILSYPDKYLLIYALLITLLIILIRIIWVYAGTYIIHAILCWLGKEDRTQSLANPFLIGWSGIRGVITLAAALSIPHTIGNVDISLERDIIIFISFVVIMITLLFQGLSLPILARWLKIDSGGYPSREIRKCKLALAEAALKRLQYLNDHTSSHLDKELASHLISIYEHRIQNLSQGIENEEELISNQYLSADRKIRMEAIMAERNELLRQYNQRIINEKTLREIETEIDLDESRLGLIA